MAFVAPLKDWLIRANAAVGISGYLAAVTIAAGLLLALALLAVSLTGRDGWLFLPLAFLGFFISVDAAITLVNRVVTDRFGPAVLPGLELRDGVSSEFRTIVVVPTLLTSSAAIEELIERLEIHYLASPDGDIQFALLSDWTDSTTECAADDEELLGAAIEGIVGLNRQYGPAPDGPRFFLFHRRRLWNESQGKWIGWERKRGKLHELNRLLRGATDTTFLAVGGRPPLAPPGVRYVITLDTDTRLPIGAAKRLIGKMAHPLNRPKLDPVSRRVVEGYGVLQPRVTPSLPTARDGSLYQRVFSSPTGIDPYAAAVSDVYQDLFEEGSYSGKGIYDVDAFEAALAGRIAESWFSATICWRVFLPARGWSPTSRSLRIFRRVTTLPHPASTDGRAATGSCCLGSLAGGRMSAAAVAGRTFRRSAAGSSRITFAALCRPRQVSSPS